MIPDLTKVWIAITCCFILIGVLFAQNALAAGYLIKDNGQVIRLGPPECPGHPSCDPGGGPPQCPPENCPPTNCGPDNPYCLPPSPWICQYDCCGDGRYLVDNPRECRQRWCVEPECPVFPDCSKEEGHPCWSTKCRRQQEFLD